MNILPVFPLSHAYLPGDDVVLRVFEDRYVAMMGDVMAGSRTFASVLISRGSEVGGEDERFDHGVVVRVDSIGPQPGSLVLSGTATECCSILEWSSDAVYPAAVVVPATEQSLSLRDLHDACSSLSLLAQRTRRILELVAAAEDGRSDADFVAVAAGRWWAEGVAEAHAWRAFWVVARRVPCGALDRYQLLRPGHLLQRIALLRQTIDHVSELVEFGLRA